MSIFRVALMTVCLIAGSLCAANAGAVSTSHPTSDVPRSDQFDLGQSRDDMAYFLGPVIADVNA